MTVTQMFPRREEGRVVHHRWEVDIEAVGRAFGTVRGGLGRIESELQQMAEHLPRWLLTLSRAGRLVSCAKCKGAIVFDRGVSCVVCGRPVAHRAMQRARPAWFGLLPPIGIDSLPNIRVALADQTPRQHVVGHRPEIGNFLLVPLVAQYPVAFPTVPPELFYLPGFFDIRGVPKEGMSHEYHMLERGRMCLFAGGQWSQTTSCREVVQQRAYPHVIKLLRYGDGKRDAFTKVT